MQGASGGCLRVLAVDCAEGRRSIAAGGGGWGQTVACMREAYVKYPETALGYGGEGSTRSCGVRGPAALLYDSVHAADDRKVTFLQYRTGNATH